MFLFIQIFFIFCIFFTKRQRVLNIFYLNFYTICPFLLKHIKKTLKHQKHFRPGFLSTIFHFCIFYKTPKSVFIFLYKDIFCVNRCHFILFLFCVFSLFLCTIAAFTILYVQGIRERKTSAKTLPPLQNRPNRTSTKGKRDKTTTSFFIGGFSRGQFFGGGFIRGHPLYTFVSREKVDVI